MASELALTIDFSATGNSQAYTAGGWAQAEKAFTWAIGAESHLRVQGPADIGECVLTLDVIPFVSPPTLPGQRLIVSVNGTVVGSSVFSRPTLLGYRIPGEIVGATGLLEIALLHPDAARASDFEISADSRLLAFSVVEAKLFRRLPDPAETAWKLPPGIMVSGKETPGFAVERPRDLTEWVGQRAGVDLAQLALAFESVGENCEFGLVQRRCGAEPLGLLRFSSTFQRALIRGIDDGFNLLGDAEGVDPRLEGDAPREYMIHEKHYRLVYHSFVYEGQRSLWLMREQETARLTFLRRKFLEELEVGEKIFVYKRNSHVPEEEILPLFMALRRQGPNTLLWVALAERDRPAGTVEVIRPGLLKGYIDRFAPEDNAHDFSFEGWMKVCANALILAKLGKAGS